MIEQTTDAKLADACTVLGEVTVCLFRHVQIESAVGWPKEPEDVLALRAARDFLRKAGYVAEPPGGGTRRRDGGER